VSSRAHVDSVVSSLSVKRVRRLENGLARMKRRNELLSTQVSRAQRLHGATQVRPFGSLSRWLLVHGLMDLARRVPPSAYERRQSGVMRGPGASGQRHFFRKAQKFALQAPYDARIGGGGELHRRTPVRHTFRGGATRCNHPGQPRAPNKPSLTLVFASQPPSSVRSALYHDGCLPSQNKRQGGKGRCDGSRTSLLTRWRKTLAATGTQHSTQRVLRD
jgi:hypothetical protein